MPNYVRRYKPGGTFFFTVVTHRRRHLFDTDLARSLLREAVGDHQEPFLAAVAGGWRTSRAGLGRPRQAPRTRRLAETILGAQDPRPERFHPARELHSLQPGQTRAGAVPS